MGSSSGFEHLQRQGCAAQLAADTDIIAGCGAAAPDFPAPGAFSDHLDGHRQRTLTKVAAYQCNTEFAGYLLQAAGKSAHPGIGHLRFRQGQRQGKPARDGCHCSHVAEIHGQRLVTDIGRVGVREKMDTGNQAVRRNCQVCIRVRSE